MAQQTGRAFITAAGKRLASKPGAKMNMGGVERTAVILDGGVAGFQETVVAPYVECVVSHDADTSLTGITAIKDATVLFETDTKRSYVLRNAWSAKPMELDKGDVSVRFEGMSCEEV